MKRSAPLVLLAVLATLTASACASRSVTTRSGARVVQGRDTVLVRIGDEPITRADVQARLDEIPEAQRAQFATPQGRQQLLDRMIEERVWLEMAAKNGVPERPQIRQQIEQQRRDLLIRTWLQEVMSANPAPSDSDARVYYDGHAEEYRTPATVTLRHIQFAREADARRVHRLARRGDDWDRLVTRHSTDTLTKSNGGLLGTVTREGMFAGIGRQPALAESAMALGSGKVGGPWRTDRGWHVVRVDEVKPESMRPFETVRPLILRQLGSQRAQEFYRRKLEEARQELKVTADSTALQGFLHQKKSARDMFREAQELGPPQARFMIGFIYSEELKDYEQADRHFRMVLDRYPNSELAASAKWMIENMRTEDAPTFAPMEADSNRTADAPRGSSGKP